jgi:hypothetical protein
LGEGGAVTAEYRPGTRVIDESEHIAILKAIAIRPVRTKSPTAPADNGCYAVVLSFEIAELRQLESARQATPSDLLDDEPPAAAGLEYSEVWPHPESRLDAMGRWLGAAALPGGAGALGRRFIVRVRKTWAFDYAMAIHVVAEVVDILGTVDEGVVGVGGKPWKIGVWRSAQGVCLGLLAYHGSDDASVQLASEFVPTAEERTRILDEATERATSALEAAGYTVETCESRADEEPSDRARRLRVVKRNGAADPTEQ